MKISVRCKQQKQQNPRNYLKLKSKQCWLNRPVGMSSFLKIIITRFDCDMTVEITRVIEKCPWRAAAKVFLMTCQRMSPFVVRISG